MLCAFILLCTLGQTIAQDSKIHEHMTPEEMLSVFHTNEQSSVPVYEVVPIMHTLHRRSLVEYLGPEVHLKAFGKNYNLTLKPTDGLLPLKNLPMWTVTRNSSEPDGLNYVDAPETSTDIGDIYQDRDNMASILLHRDVKGKVLVEGNIGWELVIRPLPNRILKKINPLSKDNSLKENLKDLKNMEETHHHIVYKRSRADPEEDYSDFAFMEPDHLAKRFRSKRSVSERSKREAPYVIFPEILCIVDYDGYRLHGGDNVQIKRYFVSFWNGVDLRYKLLKGPKIRISIAGIIISRGRDATPYLERNRVGRDAIDSAAALTDMGKYLFRERRLPVYDIAVAVTKLDMCRRQYANDVCNRGTAGFAYVGGACVVNKRLEKVNSVAIIEDTGGFSGIIVAAHEVGHLLGAVHDGSPPPSYLGGPGAEKCRWEDGYIMSDLRHTEKGFKWSHCSVSSFHHFLNGDTATCLFNAPHEDEALPRVLPGKLLSLDAQCRKDRGTSACFKDDRVCAQLFCFDAGSGYCVAYRPAAEGSPCGDGQYCLNGKCVAEHENIIPDYTQNVPTYVRRENPYINGQSQSRSIFSQYNTTENRYNWEEPTTRSSQLLNYNNNNNNNNNDNNNNRQKFTNLYTYTTNERTPPPLSTTTIKPYKYLYSYTNIGVQDTTRTTTTTSPLKIINTKPPITTTTTTESTPYYKYYTDKKLFDNLVTDNDLITKKSFYNRYSTYSYNYFPTTTTTTTTTTNSPFINYNIRNDINYYKITPFYKYKNLLPSSTTISNNIGSNFGLQNYPRGTKNGECTRDIGTDCEELIGRLRTWLCHLQSVKERCCASLKLICAT